MDALKAVVFQLIAVALLTIDSAAVAGEQQEIARLYKSGLAGDARAVEECIAKLELLLNAEPQDQLARVYLGSAYTLRSRDMSFGPAKLTMLKQGVSIMDAAVAAAPSDPQVRLVRARTADSLPFFLGRKRSTREDFAWLAKVAERSPEKFSEADLATIRAHARADVDSRMVPR